MELENYKDVANYHVASKELPKYIKEVFTLPKYGLTESAADAMTAWHHLQNIVSERIDFLNLVKKGGKFEIVSIDFNLALIDNKTNKTIKTWLVNINSDHSLHYPHKAGTEARKQRPHYGFTIMRNNNPDAVATCDSVDLDLLSKNKQKIVAHLYLPQGSKNPDHFRMKKDHKSTAEQTTPCCGHALHPRTVPFMSTAVIPLVDKRHQSTRSMKITATCETHNKGFKGPVINWTQKSITNENEAAYGKGFWAAVGGVVGLFAGAAAVVVGAFIYSPGDDDENKKS